jgi:hypothetical protein
MVLDQLLLMPVKLLRYKFQTGTKLAIRFVSMRTATWVVRVYIHTFTKCARLSS